MRELSLKDVCSMEVISSGHFDNLLFQSDTKRVWISRMTIEDGQPYNNQVTVEKLVNGVWMVAKQYEAK